MDSEVIHKTFTAGTDGRILLLEDLKMNTQLTPTKAITYTFALALAGLLAWTQAGTIWGKEGNGQVPVSDGKSTWIMATEEDKQETEVDWTLAGKDTRDSSEDDTDWTLAQKDAKESEEDEPDWTLAQGESEDGDEDETDWTIASNDSSKEEEEVDWTLA